MSVNNDNTEKNPVGRFMVAVGAIIRNAEGKILLIKRSKKLDFRPDDWEIMYGRIAQHEDAKTGLLREVKEELGIEIEIERPLSVWHIYRGEEKTAYNELIGITFTASAKSTKVTISDEHEEYRWVTPDEALTLITTDGIRDNIKDYINLSANHA